jgi:hypothetical protein
MASEMIALRRQAQKANVAGYKSMSVEELRSALASGKTATVTKDGAKSKRKSAAVVKTATKRKTSSAKSAPAAKSTKKGEAKRPTTKRKSTPKAEKPKRGRPPGSRNKAKATATRKPAARKNGEGGTRNLIDTSAIDWSAEWSGGSTGIRQIIFKALKKRKGNRKKVFEDLQDQAVKMWPKDGQGRKRSKASAEAMLKWNISRVAFDFVMATGQHKIAKDNAHHSRAQANGSGKAMAAPKKRGRPKGSGKSTTKPASRQKASQGRAKASSKTAAKKTGKSKPTGKRGRPPGIPMSAETKAKIAATRAKNKRAKAKAEKAKAKK